jgi:YidC/Oxa1 family membrane protein insertase
MMDTNRNTFLAIALSLVVLLGWQFLYVNPKLEAERKAAEIQRKQEQATTGGAAGTAAGTATPSAESSAVPGTSAVVPGSGGAQQAATREEALSKLPRIAVENSDLIGSLNLKGGRLDDLKLKNYRETIKRDSPLVTLLSPSELKDGYFAEFGFVASAGSGEAPGPDTMWTIADGAKLTPETPVTLSWTNPQGIVFTRTVSVDPHYLFTVIDSVRNPTASDIKLSPYGRVTRFDRPQTVANYVLHEGMIGVWGEEGLQQITYSGIEDDREFASEGVVTGGWLGITDKYWAATLVPPGDFKARYSFFDDGRTRFQADYLGTELAIPAGQSVEIKQLLFAGAKEVAQIDAYEASAGIKNFELLIDWGWFYFITKPLFWLLDYLNRVVGNFGVAILVATVLIKLVLYPLANMSYRSMANMKKMQPEMLSIRDRYPDDKVKQQQEMMALYKREKINPAAGCWPVLIQIPIFFALYKVLFITIEMRHAPFFGWIQDLAAPDPTTIFNLFGLLPFTAPAWLPLLGIWPIIMGITMFLQMQMNPTPPDPTQAMIFRWMPVVFTFMLGTFPAGLVIYWAWNNLLSILQQGVIMHQQGAKIELWDNLKALFRRSPKPAE